MSYQRPEIQSKITIALGVATVCLVVFIAGCEKESVARRTTKASSVSELTLEQELKQVGEQLLEVIKTGNTDGFLRLCSKDGVSFGTDEANTPLEVLRREVQENRGAYCLLFDTDCLREQVGFENYFSFRQLVTEADRIEIKAYLVRGDDVLAGEVRIFLSGGPVTQVPDMNPLDFQFVREEGAWKLGAVPY